MQVIYSDKEAKLIQELKKQNRKAQRTLFNAYADKMLMLCLRYIRQKEIAEDILQESFIQLFEKIDQFKGKGSFEGWMKRIFVNNCLMHCRKNQRIIYSDTLPDIAILSVEPVNTKIEVSTLFSLIQELPSGYRNVFNMYALDGYTHKEIGKQLGISENTSKSQYSRARKLLQEKIVFHDKTSSHEIG